MKLLKLSSCLLITFLCSQTVSSQFFDPSQFTNSDPRQSPLPSNSPQHFPSFDRGLFGSQSSSPFRFFHSPSSPSSSNLQTIQSGDPSNPSFTRFGSFSRPLTSPPEGLPADEISALNEANSRFINPFTQPQAQSLPQLNPRPSQPPSDSAFTEPGNFNSQPSPLGLPSPQPASPLGLPQPNEERRFNGEPGVVYEENENTELSSQGQPQFRPQFRQQHSSQPFVNPEFFGFGNQQRPPTSGEQSRPQLPIPQPQEQPQPQSQLFQPQEQPRSQFAPPQVPQPQLNPQLSPETQFQPQSQTSQPQSPQLAVQPQSQFSAQPQFQHQHQPQPQPQIPQPQTQPELQFPPQPPSNPQFQFSSQFQPQSQPQPQPQPQSQSQPQPQPQPQLQPQPQFQSNFQFTPPQLQPQTQPQAQPQLQPEIQFTPQSRPQPQPNPQQFPPSDSVGQPNPSPQPALQFISLPPPQEAQRQPQPQRQPRPQPQVQPQTQPQPQSQSLPQNRPVPAPRPVPRPAPSQPIAPFPVNDDNLLIALYGLEANRSSPPTYSRASQPAYSQPLSAPTLSRDNNNDNDNIANANANANGNSNINFNVDLPLLRSFMEANNIRVHQHTPLYNLRKVESDTPTRTSGETFSFSTPSPTPLIRITTAPTTSTPSPSLNTSNAFNFGSLRDSLVYSDEFTRHQPRTSNQFDSNTSHGTSSFPSTSAPLPAPTSAPRPTQALPNYQPDVVRTSNQPSRTIAVSGQYLGPQLPRRTYAQPTQAPYQPPRPTTTTPSPNTESAFEANFDLSEPENDDEGLANLRSTNYFPDLQRIKPVNRTSTSYSVSVSSSASFSPSLSSNYNVGNYPITSLPAATVTRAEVPTTTPYPNEYIRVATSSSLPSSLPVVTEPPYGTSLNRAAASYDLRSSNYPSEPANRVLNIQSSGYGNVRGGANQIARTRYANGRQSSPRSSSAAFPPPSSPSTASPVIYPINFYKHVDELVTPQSNPTTVITTTTTPLPTTFTPEVAPSFSSSDYNNNNFNNNINGDNPEDSSRPVVHSNARQPSVRSNSVRSYLQANNFRSNVRRVVAVRRGPNGVRTNTILRSTAGSPLAPSSSSSSSSSFPVAPNQSQPTSYRIARIVPSQPSPSTTVAPPTTQSQPLTQDLPSNDRVKSNRNLPADTDGDGVPGEAGKDYPTHVTIPKTSFSCANVPNNGYYADTEAQCQVVHLCQSGGTQDSFLCPNGTIFNQQKFSCQWWYQVDCNAAPTYYELNDNFQSARLNPSSSSSSTRTRSANGLAQ